MIGSLLLISAVFPLILCEPVIYWNFNIYAGTQKCHLSQQFAQIPAASNPLLVFVKPDFDVSGFSDAASVYSEKSSGGHLKHLKDIMDHSSDYGIFHACSGALTDIQETLLPLINDNEIVHYSENIDVSKAAVIFFDAPNSWTELDSFVSDVMGKIKSKNYRAVLLGKSAPHSISKRAANDNEEDTSILFNKTNILFYSSIARVVFKAGVAKAGKSTWYIEMHYQDATVKTENDGVTLTFDFDKSKTSYAIPVDDGGKPAVDGKLTVELSFNSSAGGMWYMREAKVTASSITDPAGTKLNNGAETTYLACVRRSIYQYISVGDDRLCKMDAPRDWGYACTEMDPLWFNFTSASGKTPDYYIGFQFWEMHMQLNSSSGQFSRNVDDCGEFFTAGIWMGIISMSVFLLVFFFGISMVANLKTPSRYDDPRQKPLVINVKE